MGLYKQKLNTRSGQFNLVPSNQVVAFKSGVPTYADLPTEGNEQNDARITNDTHHLYVWDSSSWIDQGDLIDLTWAAIEGKPSSTPANIDDAVDKKHAHSNKTILDAIQEALTTALKSDYDGAVNDSHTHANKDQLDGWIESNGITINSDEPYLNLHKPSGENIDIKMVDDGLSIEISEGLSDTILHIPKLDVALGTLVTNDTQVIIGGDSKVGDLIIGDGDNLENSARFIGSLDNLHIKGCNSIILLEGILKILKDGGTEIANIFVSSGISGEGLCIDLSELAENEDYLKVTGNISASKNIEAYGDLYVNGVIKDDNFFASVADIVDAVSLKHDGAAQDTAIGERLIKEGTNKITVGIDEPTDPDEGDLWVDTN